MWNSFDFLFTRITGKLSEIAVNGFDHLCSFDGIKSVEGVANQPKILTRCGEFSEGYWSAAYEMAQRVHAERSCQLSPAKIQSSDGQKFFVCNDTCTQKRILLIKISKL